ncbi:SDR family oxidoreductase, partial [Burkholderia pseudomallei]
MSRQAFDSSTHRTQGAHVSQLSSDPISGAPLAGRTAFVTGGGRGLGAA